ncbi:MAG: hypothetical protein JSS18_02900 [Proteobacteria bacterium]|nr:hypothetical protein [Pseudomonadota bacterium]
MAPIAGGPVMHTLLGRSAPRIPVAGRIRAGIKVLKRSAAQSQRARSIYEAGVAAGKGFDAIERELAQAVPDLQDPLTPKNVPYFTVRGEDFANPELAQQIMALYGEDRGEGLHLYRFPVVFPADAWQQVMPHELVTWTASERRYWSEYAEDGQTRWCRTYEAPAKTNGRALRVFGGRKMTLRAENGGLCDPERCPEYQARRCNLSGRFIFFIPGIKSISAFELPTNSFYAMQRAIEKFQTIGFMRGGRISGFLDDKRTPFYIGKRLVEVSRLDEEGRPTRVAQWLIELEAPVDVTALLRHGEDIDAVELRAAAAATVLQGHDPHGVDPDDVLDPRPEGGIPTEYMDATGVVCAAVAGSVAGPAACPPEPVGEWAGPKTQRPAPTERAPAATKPAAARPARAPVTEADNAQRELQWILDAAAALGVDADTFERYAARRWGQGWRMADGGRKRALRDVEGFQEDAAGFVARVRAELEAWA